MSPRHGYSETYQFGCFSVEMRLSATQEMPYVFGKEKFFHHEILAQQELTKIYLQSGGS